MSVCLSVRWHITRTAGPNFKKLCAMLPVAVALSSSDDNAISNVLPVLWMTSCTCFFWGLWPALIVRFGKLLGEDFVAKLLALTSSYWLQIKKLFRQMSNTQHCLHPLLLYRRNNKISKVAQEPRT